MQEPSPINNSRRAYWLPRLAIISGLAATGTTIFVALAWKLNLIDFSHLLSLMDGRNVVQLAISSSPFVGGVAYIGIRYVFKGKEKEPGPLWGLDLKERRSDALCPISIAYADEAKTLRQSQKKLARAIRACLPCPTGDPGDGYERSVAFLHADKLLNFFRPYFESDDDLPGVVQEVGITTQSRHSHDQEGRPIVLPGCPILNEHIPDIYDRIDQAFELLTEEKQRSRIEAIIGGTPSGGIKSDRDWYILPVITPAPSNGDEGAKDATIEMGDRKKSLSLIKARLGRGETVNLLTSGKNTLIALYQLLEEIRKDPTLRASACQIKIAKNPKSGQPTIVITSAQAPGWRTYFLLP